MLISSFAWAKDINLNTKNTVILRGSVDDSSVQKAQMDLAKLVAERRSSDMPIYLVIDSPGGSVTSGLAFIQFAKKIKNLHTISMFAASMGSAIAELLPGRRYITEDGIMMFHRAKGSFQGQFGNGEVESKLGLWKKIIGKMEQDMSARIGISWETYKVRRLNEWWVLGHEAAKLGVADEQIDITCSNKLINKRISNRLDDVIGRYSVVYSGCPLLRNPLPIK